MTLVGKQIKKKIERKKKKLKPTKPTTLPDFSLAAQPYEQVDTEEVILHQSVGIFIAEN